jgi:mRNA interferase MazF
MQYEIFWANLDPTKGSEISKTRPCVVISPDEMNRPLKTVVIVPLTSTIKDYPSRFVVPIGKEKYEVAIDQIRSISKERLGKPLKTKPKLTVEEVDELKSKFIQIFIR